MTSRPISREVRAMREANSRADEARRQLHAQTTLDAAKLGMTRVEYLYHLEDLAKKEGVCRTDFDPKW